MSVDGQRTKWRRNIAENFSRLSRVHERYRQTNRRQTTDGRTTTYSVTFANNLHPISYRFQVIAAYWSIFSERERDNMSSAVRLSVVCRH